MASRGRRKKVGNWVSAYFRLLWKTSVLGGGGMEESFSTPEHCLREQRAKCARVTSRGVGLWCFKFFSVLFLGAGGGGGGNDIQWCFSQVKGAVDDDVAEGKNSLS